MERRSKKVIGSPRGAWGLTTPVLFCLVLLLLLYTVCVAEALVSDSTSASSSAHLPSTTPSTTPTTTTTAPATTTENPVATTTSTAVPPPPTPMNTTAAPPPEKEKWANMTIEFFAIFVSVAGGVGVIAFIVITLLCCREYKLLETSDDSDEESVYSGNGSTPSTSSGDEPEAIDDTASQTQRSWDAESIASSHPSDETEENSKQPHRHRHRHRRHHRRSRRESTPTSEEEAEEGDGVAEGFWNNSF